MLEVYTKVDNMLGLEKHIRYVEMLLTMKTDINFQKYIQQKCMEVLEKTMNNRFGNFTTTNSDSVDIYKSSNHLLETNDGFIIYNDAKIPANVKGIQNQIENYPNGEFNLALAFEYGVGIVGTITNNSKAWNYNVQGYNFGWVLPRDVARRYGIQVGQEFAGYQGYEIYRFTADEIKTQLPNWVKNYYRQRRNS